MTISTLESIRDDASFVAFWQKVTALAEKYDIGEPVLPRKRGAPSRFEDGLAPPAFPSSVGDHFWIYFEGIDNVIGGLTDWFEQPGYSTYSQLEQLLIRPVRGRISIMNLTSAVISTRMLREPVFNLNCLLSGLTLFSTASKTLAMS